MPGLWNSAEFKASGFDSIKKFKGTLTNVEEDVEGKYGPQIEMTWDNVELLEAGEEVELADDRLTDWIKQTSRKNSTNQKMVLSYEDFKKESGLKGSLERFEFLIGVPCIYEREEYDFGADINPGSAYIPVEVVEDKGKRRPAAADEDKKPVKSRKPVEPPVEEDDEAEEAEEAEIDEALVDAIKEAAEEGATPAEIKSHVNRAAASRKALAAAGTLSDVLKALVEAEILDEEDGVYTTAAKPTKTK